LEGRLFGITALVFLKSLGFNSVNYCENQTTDGFPAPTGSITRIPNISFSQGYNLWRFIDTQVHPACEKGARHLSWISGTEDGLFAY
jgi:hypothetical protein